MKYLPGDKLIYSLKFNDGDIVSKEISHEIADALISVKTEFGFEDQVRPVAVTYYEGCGQVVEYLKSY